MDVLKKWSSNEIRKSSVEELIKNGNEVDENLDDLEKVIEIVDLWRKEGPNVFNTHNHLLNLNDYSMINESRNLSNEKKIEVLNSFVELVINVSKKNISDDDIDNILNNIYQ